MQFPVLQKRKKAFKALKETRTRVEHLYSFRGLKYEQILNLTR